MFAILKLYALFLLISPLFAMPPYTRPHAGYYKEGLQPENAYPAHEEYHQPHLHEYPQHYPAGNRQPENPQDPDEPTDLTPPPVDPPVQPPGISQCDTGNLQCCNSVQEANANSPLALLLGLLNVGNTGLLIGLTCTPITVVGIGSNSCTQQPVCCTGNNFNGVIVIGCSPISNPIVTIPA